MASRFPDTRFILWGAVIGFVAVIVFRVDRVMWQFVTGLF